MSNLDEESFEQKSEVDENSGVSDELSDVDDEELLSEFNNENKFILFYLRANIVHLLSKIERER